MFVCWFVWFYLVILLAKLLASLIVSSISQKWEWSLSNPFTCQPLGSRLIVARGNSSLPYLSTYPHPKEYIVRVPFALWNLSFVVVVMSLVWFVWFGLRVGDMDTMTDCTGYAILFSSFFIFFYFPLFYQRLRAYFPPRKSRKTHQITPKVDILTHLCSI